MFLRADAAGIEGRRVLEVPARRKAPFPHGSRRFQMFSPKDVPTQGRRRPALWSTMASRDTTWTTRIGLPGLRSCLPTTSDVSRRQGGARVLNGCPPKHPDRRSDSGSRQAGSRRMRPGSRSCPGADRAPSEHHWPPGPSRRHLRLSRTNQLDAAACSLDLHLGEEGALEALRAPEDARLLADADWLPRGAWS